MFTVHSLNVSHITYCRPLSFCDPCCNHLRPWKTESRWDSASLQFTSLHWAAKHGNADVIKLIAGTHRANPNVRSHGGYTPLHLAAMFCHEEIMEILIHSYGADPNMRDYSGKKPHQYLPESISQQYEAATNYCVKPSLGFQDDASSEIRTSEEEEIEETNDE
ncbi:ankyrin repeat domain-containing protein SOWAHC-like isoform X5 [Centruroides sculpturatus]|uniref:ankyrin repeat domain-containing protein SOWAHC-like isoform X5 n=1 Tax=Centruroides sculpturatus TaxID=218467 RepID=UPI000C6CE5C8|nr:ankyrin repeat domain-containing protein SOWAHC-like isoform X5 [Centruroides sculpturatus]